MRYRANQDGAAAVEFGLLLLPLILLLGAIIDFGLVFNAQLGLTHAAREGVRVTALNLGDGGTRAEEAYTGRIRVTSVNGDVSNACPNPDGDAQVVIHADYDFIFLGIIPGFDSANLQGQAVMRCSG